MTIDTLLCDLGSRIGLPGLDFGPEGVARLEIDGVVVELTRGSSDVLLLSTLAGELVPGDEAGAAMRLLAANALFCGTDGATIGVPAGSTAVVLAREVHAAGTNADALAAILDRFTATALGVATLLQTPAPTTGKAPERLDVLNMTRV